MHFARQFLRHAAVVAYLVLTLLAFLHTMSHAPVFLRVPGVLFAYGMMAPYQGIEREAVDLRAEGRDAAGAWHAIDLAPYYPVGAGEAIARRYLFPFRAEGPGAMRVAYARLAVQLRDHEREQGRVWAHVRLSWDTWPLSEEGYQTLRRDPRIHSTVLAEVP